MEFHISAVEEKDFDELFLIEQQAHQVPWSLGTLKNNQGAQYLNLKIEDQQQILGFAICHLVLDEATLFNIAIQPAFQGKGLGFQLLAHLISQLKQQNVQTLWLEVRESNLSAQRLYEKLGFNQVDIRKNYYPCADGQRENAVVMACYLGFAD